MKKVMMSVVVIAVLAAGCAKETESEAMMRYTAAVARKDYAEAAKALRKLPDRYMKFYNLGMAELETGRLRRAAGAFEEAIALTTDNTTDAVEGLARVRMLQGRYAEANELYEDAMTQAGRTPRLLAGRAGVELKRKQTELALALLKEALAINVDEPVALFNMGVALEALPDITSAASKKYFEQFLNYAPESDVKARKKAEAVIKRHASRSSGPSVRSESLIMQSRRVRDQDKAESVRLAQLAMEEDPLSADAVLNLAEALAREGSDASRAMRAYARFASQFPNDPRVANIPQAYRITQASSVLLVARSAAQSGKWQEAFDAFARYLHATPHAPAEIWVEYCVAAQKLSPPNVSAAQRAAERALELRKDYPPAVRHLGVIQIQRGNKKEGEQTIRRYLNMIPAGQEKRDLEAWLKRVI